MSSLKKFATFFSNSTESNGKSSQNSTNEPDDEQYSDSELDMADESDQTGLHQLIVTNDPSKLNSSFSFLMMLTPLLMGTTNETLDELLQLLSLKKSELPSYVRSIQNDLHTIKSSPEIITSTIMLSRADIALKDAYLANISNMVDHSYFEPTDPAKIVQYVNNVVKTNTKGMIDNILNNGDVDGDLFAIFLNTVYFNCKWEDQFLKFQTRTKLFNKERQVPFMNLSDSMCRYTETDSHQIAMLKYRSNKFAFGIVLPKNPTERPPVHNILDRTSIFMTTLINSKNFETLDVSLPKFTAEIEINLIPYLKQSGITKLFDGTMQYENMTDLNHPMKMSVIKQKVKLIVNEAGTTASSATAGVMALEGFCPQEKKPIYLNCDHPFTYYIVHMSTQTILFSGIYE